MTQAETHRGRGRPKAFDEIAYAAKIHSIEDLERVRAALEANGASPWAARGPVAMLQAIVGGDPTGGVSTMSRYRYRLMLAELGSKDPLRGNRRGNGRIAARSERGIAARRLVGVAAGAGMLGLAVISPSPEVRLALCSVPPIMLQQPYELAELGLAA